MKILLEFDAENETEKRDAKMAQLGPYSAAMIDSFFDYLLVVIEPFLASKQGKDMTAQELYDKIYNMYTSKIFEYGVVETLDEELQDLIVSADLIEDED